MLSFDNIDRMILLMIILLLNSSTPICVNDIIQDKYDWTTTILSMINDQFIKSSIINDNHYYIHWIDVDNSSMIIEREKPAGPGVRGLEKIIISIINSINDYDWSLMIWCLFIDHWWYSCTSCTNQSRASIVSLLYHVIYVDRSTAI